MITILPPEPTKPPAIFAAMLDRAFGECWIRLMFASTVKMHWPHSTLAVYFRDDRPYKRDMIACCPYVDHIIPVTPDHARGVALDLFYAAADRFEMPSSKEFVAHGYAASDLILTPHSMLEIDLLRYPTWPQFRLPADRRAELLAAMEAAGLRPDKPHVVIHYRDASYPLRPDTPYRSVTSDEPFLTLANYLIYGLGLTVVRIGNPEMRAWPTQQGNLINLSRAPFLVQVAAISTARFCVMTMGGPASIPNAFGVPSMVSNAVGYAASGADPGFLLPKSLVDGDGNPMPLQDIIAAGGWTSEACWHNSKAGARFLDNTTDELKAGVEQLMLQTYPWSGGWREPQQPPHHIRPQPYAPRAPFVRSVNVMFPE